MSDWGMGFATGIAVGLTIGLSIGRKRKPWSEMNEKEKKIRIGVIAAGVVLLAVGIIVSSLVSQ